MSVTGKERREVPLPSQEGKKGVMQYALYVYSVNDAPYNPQYMILPRGRRNSHFFTQLLTVRLLAPPSIKWRTGHVNLPYGP